MRLSCLAVTVLLIASSTLLAQHSSGASGSGGGSHSSAPSFSGSVSAGSSHAGSGSSASHVSAGSHSLARSSSSTINSGNSVVERRHFSFPWHKRSSPQLASWRPTPCLHGHNCMPCRAGSRSGVGMCTQPQNVSCFAGQVWNGSFCVSQNWWSNDCAALASQLEAQRRRMRGLNDPGQSLIYQQLRNQYLSCLSRRGLGLGSYALNDMSLFNSDSAAR